MYITAIENVVKIISICNNNLSLQIVIPKYATCRSVVIYQ